MTAHPALFSSLRPSRFLLNHKNTHQQDLIKFLSPRVDRLSSVLADTGTPSSTPFTFAVASRTISPNLGYFYEHQAPIYGGPLQMRVRLASQIRAPARLPQHKATQQSIVNGTTQDRRLSELRSHARVRR